MYDVIFYLNNEAILIGVADTLSDAASICDTDGQTHYSIFDQIGLRATWAARGGLALY